MKYLKNLMLTFPFFERVPDQSVIAGTNGERYDRAIATRGNDYLLVYNYSGRPKSWKNLRQTQNSLFHV